jgi:hypothetical protein
MTTIEVICAYAPFPTIRWEVIDETGRNIKGRLRRINLRLHDAYVKVDLANPYMYLNFQNEVCYTHDPKVPYENCKPYLKEYEGDESALTYTEVIKLREEGYAIGLNKNQYIKIN